MTEKTLREMFKLWQGRLNLDHWTLEVKIGGCEGKSSFMEVSRSYDYDRASIHVQPWLLTGEPPEDISDIDLTLKFVEERVVHELLHLHMREMMFVVYKLLDCQLHRDVDKLLLTAFDHAEEGAVDRLSQTMIDRWGS